MNALLYKTLTSDQFTNIQVNSIPELYNIINENETLSKYLDKKQSVNLFACRKLENWENIPLEFSWIDIDGAGHSGVSDDEIKFAVKKLVSEKIPFLVFKTQHERCYKIICHVTYKSGMALDYDEYKQINEKFQKHIFRICKLKDYEEGSCSPTKGFCLSKNGLKMFNNDLQAHNILFEYEAPVRQLAQTSGYDSSKTEKEKFEYALKFVTTDICPDFDSWTRCAMALNKTFGEAGFAYFEQISNYYSNKQTPAQVVAKYKNCQNATRVSIGSVYKLIEDAGIKIDWTSFFEREKPIKQVKESKKKEVEKDLAVRFSETENRYYMQLHTFFSIEELKEIMQENGINPDKYDFGYDNRKPDMVVIHDKNRKEVSINHIFSQKYDEFTKICTKKHFALYSDVESDKFSFNFTTEELTTWLCSYPQTIFRNYEYNRALHSINPSVDNSERFNVERTITTKIENLFNSGMNVQEKKFKDFKPRLIESIKIFINEFEMRVCGGIKQNNGWIDEVVKKGHEYISSHAGSDIDGYWFEALNTLFSVTEDDFYSIISFITNSIKVRLYADPKAMRAMIVTGDSGIGKDSFLVGCFTGLNYEAAKEYVHKGSLYGATGFSSATSEKLRSIFYNYISDDLAAANRSTNLDTITETFLPVEVKGSTQMTIQKRFNTIVTNNDPGVIFSKDKDHNAIARRVNFCSVKYAKGCNSMDYKRFYAHYNGQFDGFWAGLFTFCYELEKFDNTVYMMSDRAQMYTLNSLHKLFYNGNEDSRVLDALTSMYFKRKNNPDPFASTSTENDFITEIKDKSYYIIRSLDEFWSKDNKFSKKYVQKICMAHVKDCKADTSVRLSGKPVFVALKIPIEYFEVIPECEDEIEEIADKVDLITEFKKYI